MTAAAPMSSVPSFDGTRIAYLHVGPALPADLPPVLLLHGFASEHAADWVRSGVVDALVATGRPVIAADARGHGASDRPHDPGAYAGDAMVRDASAVVDDLALDAVDVVGYSMGGLVAARLAAADPRVRALVVAGAGGDLRRVSSDSGDGGLAAALLVDDPERITHPVGRAFRDFADRSGADRRALAAVERSTSLTTDVDLDAISVPTLVLIGERDRRVGSPEAVADRIRGARVRRVPGDHLDAIHRSEFAKALTAFLGEVDTS